MRKHLAFQATSAVILQPVDSVVEGYALDASKEMPNSRLKDFYDLWLTSRTFDFDGAGISAAVQRTFERRETPMPTDVPTGLTRLYAEQSDLGWKAFLGREHMNAAPDDLNQVLEDLRRFLVPLATPLSTNLHWPAGGPWSEGI